MRLNSSGERKLASQARAGGRNRVVSPAAGIDSILEYDLAKDFDMSNADIFTSNIETATVAFIDEIERFLSEHQLHEEATFHD